MGPVVHLFLESAEKSSVSPAGPLPDVPPMAAASVPAPASTPVGTPVGAEAAVSSPDLESGGAEGSAELVGTQDIESMDS